MKRTPKVEAPVPVASAPVAATFASASSPMMATLASTIRKMRPFNLSVGAASSRTGRPSLLGSSK